METNLRHYRARLPPREIPLRGDGRRCAFVVFFYLASKCSYRSLFCSGRRCLPYLQLPSMRRWCTLTLKHYFDIPARTEPCLYINTGDPHVRRSHGDDDFERADLVVVIRTQVSFRGFSTRSRSCRTRCQGFFSRSGWPISVWRIAHTSRFMGRSSSSFSPTPSIGLRTERGRPTRDDPGASRVGGGRQSRGRVHSAGDLEDHRAADRRGHLQH